MISECEKFLADFENNHKVYKSVLDDSFEEKKVDLSKTI
jgi:hypothetical protein